MATPQEIESVLGKWVQTEEPTPEGTPQITVNPGAMTPSGGMPTGTADPAEIEALLQKWEATSPQGTGAPGPMPGPQAPADPAVDPTGGQGEFFGTERPTPVPGSEKPGFAGMTFQNAFDIPLPPEASSEVTATFNFLRALNQRIATGLAAPSDTVEALVTGMSLGTIPSVKHGELNKAAFESAGIRTDPLNGLSAQLGDATFDGAVQSIAFIAASPYLAGRVGMTAGQLILRHLGEAIKNNPGLSTAANIFGSVGTRYGTHITEDMEPGIKKSLVQPAAELAGGMVGGMVAQGTKSIGQSLVNATKKVGRTIGAIQKPAPLDPLREPNFDVGQSNLGTFVKTQVDNAKDMLDRALVQALDSVPQRGTSWQLESRSRGALERAREIGRRIEGEFWTRVDQRRRVPVTDLRRQVRAMEVELRDSSFERPQRYIDEIDTIGTPMRDPATGRYVQAPPTIRRLRDLSKRIANDISTERGAPMRGGTPNDGLIRNYSRLLHMIDSSITAAYPNDVTLRQAREFSTRFSDMFRRGGVADVLAMRARGDQRVPDELTIENLMKDHQGLAELIDIRNRLVYTRQPGANRFAVTQAERQELQALVTDTEDAVRSMYREAADAKGAAEGPKWFAKHEKQIRPLARVAAEIEHSASQVKTILERQKALDRSALNRFVEHDDPTKAIQNVWSGRNPVQSNAQILRAIGNDPAAMRGYRVGMVDEFWNRSKMDPLASKKLIETPAVREMMADALGPDKWKRFRDNVNVAYQVASHNESKSGKVQNVAKKGSIILAAAGTGAYTGTFAEALLPSAMLVGGIVGAGVGRQVAHLTGGGTVQTPGIVASAFRRSMEKAFRGTNPQTLLAYAIVDPRMEKLLMSRLPETNEEMRIAVQRMKRLAVGLNASREIALEAYEGDER